MNTVATSRATKKQSDVFLTPEVIATLKERLKNKEKGIPLKEAEKMLKEEIAKYKSRKKK